MIFVLKTCDISWRWVGMLMLSIGIGHPIFTAYLFNYIGDGMLSANLILTFVLAFFFGLMVLLRIGEEQAVLVEKFGNNYHDLMKRTGRFSPKV